MFGEFVTPFDYTLEYFREKYSTGYLGYTRDNFLDDAKKKIRAKCPTLSSPTILAYLHRDKRPEMRR
jgi:hypothetical protein